MAGSVPGGRTLSFLSSSLEGSDLAAGGREGSCLFAACDQPFLGLGGGVATVRDVRGDIVRGARCVSLRDGRSSRRTLGTGIQGVSRALGSFEEAWRGARDGRWPAAARGFGIYKRIWQNIIKEAGLQIYAKAQ